MEIKGKVLVVDDDPAICTMMEDILELEGYSVTTAPDGYSALRIASENTFDVVLMDIKMPGLNGVETLKKIKKIIPGTPVIMITAFAVEDLIEESLREGAFTALKKPLDFDLLFNTIESACGAGGFVMVVDDDAATCQVIRDNLEENGYKVVVEHDGESAVARAKVEKHDAIILDMHLPVMNGFETFLAIREIRPEAFIIMITGFPDKMSDLVAKAVEKGAYINMTKPLNMNELFDILNEITKYKEK